MNTNPQVKQSVVKAKLSIIVPAIVAVTLFVLSVLVTPWAFLAYAICGVIFGRLIYGKHVEPLIGDFTLALTWGLYVVFAVVLCWFEPYKELNLRQFVLFDKER